MMIPELPPHNVEAEQSVIASILVEPTCLDEVADIVEPGDFFREVHRWTYEAALRLHNRREPVNQVTIADELEHAGRLEDVGGLAFLSDLVLNLTTWVGVAHYAKIVKRDSIYRRLIDVAMKVAQRGYQGGADVDDAIEEAERLVRSVTEALPARGFIPLQDYLDPYLEEPESNERGSQRHRKHSGIRNLDGILRGFGQDDLIIVAARTGVGKTALMLNFARNAAVQEGATVAIFSLEMSGDQLAQRLLAAEARVDSTKLRIGSHTEDEESRIMRAHGILSSASVYVDDTPGLRIPQLRAKLARLQREHGLDLVIVDYLQLMQGEHGGRDLNRVQEISFITRNLKQIARELSVPIIAGSQLSRALEQRSNHRPMLSDLRESGSIEQDADVVIFIHREDVFVTRAEWEQTHADRVNDPYPENVAELMVEKHRNGPTGVAVTRFLRPLSRFEDVAGDEQERML